MTLAQIHTTSKMDTIESLHETLKEDQFMFLDRLEQEYKKGMMALNSLGEYTVTFYGGSRVPIGSPTYESMMQIAKKFGEFGWGSVTGGGPGVMSAALEGAKLGGGRTVSFMISINGEPPFSNPDVAICFDNFSARKYCLRQSDVFIYAPGGIGTLDELMENVTLMNTGKTPKKPIFLYGKNFWKPYTDWFETLVYKEKLANEDFLKLFHVVDSPREIFEILGLDSKLS